MKQTILFSKMHGAGNDYIYVNTLLYNIDDPSKLARLWSDRHKGIGSDGLVLIGRSPIPEADFSMRIFNADGSEAMMCGNACRCIGKYLYEKGLTDKTEIRLLTPSGLKLLKLKLTSSNIVETVTVDMGEPVFDKEKQFNPTKKMLPEGLFISMGNPHCVVFGDNPEKLDLAAIGPEFEHHPAFPEQVNTEFVQVIDGHTLRMRVWERGSGETMACGTGACATVAAAVKNGFCQPDTDITVHLNGGDLVIRYTEETVTMAGEAVLIFSGEIEV